MSYLDHIYDIVKRDCEGLDSVYGDYIEHLVGVYGLIEMAKHGMLEACGVINGRQLYVLCEKK